MRSMGRGFSVLLSVAVVAVLILYGCASHEPLESAATRITSTESLVTRVAAVGLPRSFKQYELYSWKSDGTWHFTLITGTNRLKTHAEVTAPEDLEEGEWVKITVTGVPALQSLLGRLPPGTLILWNRAHPTEADSTESRVRLRMPPRRRIREIQTYCTTLGLRLETGP